MKILFVAPFGLRKKTTVWARTLPLARELVDLGHEADIVIPPWDSPADAGTTREQDGVRLINVGLSGGIPGTVRSMLQEVDRRRPDIVHIVKPRAHAGLVHWWLHQPWSARRRLVLDVDDWEQAWAAVNDYGRPVARFLAWQEEWGLRHAPAVTAASRWLEARVHEYRPETPVLYLPNGVTIPEKQSDGPAANPAPIDKPLVLFYSRFVEVEPAWLARFWTAVLDAVPDAQLVIAGSAFRPGQEDEFQAAVAADAPAAFEQMTWPGFVNQATQNDLYARATCAVFPARPVPLQQAKCSVRLATTLLNGVPVIASAVGEQQHYGANGAALLVPPLAQPEEFAGATVELMKSPRVQWSMIQQAHRHLEANYTWPRLGRQLSDFYATLAE